MKSLRTNPIKEEKVRLQMSSMIDIVFLLLSFFVITYKTPELEGDFSIRMPAQAASLQVSSMDELTPVTIRLTSDGNGNLSGIVFGSQNLGIDMNRLRQSVFQYVQTSDAMDFQTALHGNEVPHIRDDFEVELDFDDNLRYKYIMQAITAITGYINGDNQMIKLVEKIKFTPLQKSKM